MTLTELTLRFARYLLYTEQHRMGQFSGSADCCNLWELIQASLGEGTNFPQVPLSEIVEVVKRKMTIAPDERPPNPLDLAYWTLGDSVPFRFDRDYFMEDTIAYLQRQQSNIGPGFSLDNPAK